MSMERRQFLRASLLAAGGAAAGALVSRTAHGEAETSSTPSSNGRPATATLALTPDGDLVVNGGPNGAS